MKNNRKTIICDIDGTLVKHNKPSEVSKPSYKMKVLPGTLEKILEWEKRGYNIILLTGRRESTRKVTEKQLSEAGITYDQLIMGVCGGDRILINDRKTENSDDTAFSICVDRDTGVKDIWI